MKTTGSAHQGIIGLVEMIEFFHKMLWTTQMNFLANPITLVDPDRKGFPSLARQRGNRLWELHPVLIQILRTQMNLRRRSWWQHTQRDYCNLDSSWEYSWWPCCRRNDSSEIACIGTLRALLYMKIREGVMANSWRNSKGRSTMGMAWGPGPFAHSNAKQLEMLTQYPMATEVLINWN